MRQTPSATPPRVTLSSNGTPGNDVRAIPGPGEPLDAVTRAFMEPRLGHDFGSVRVHAHDAAARAARALHSQAYTAGEHIGFANGRFAPSTDAGKALLAHELAHVIQQRRSGTVTIARKPDGELSHDAPPFNTGAFQAYIGTSLVKSVAITHWSSDQERQEFIRNYIQYAATRPDRKALYDEAVAAYPDVASAPAANAAFAGKTSAAAKSLPPPDVKALKEFAKSAAAKASAQAIAAVPMGGGYDDYKDDPDYIDNFSRAGYDPMSKTLHLFFPDGGEAIVQLPLRNTGVVLVFERKSLLNSPGPNDLKIYPTLADKARLRVITQWLSDHAEEMVTSGLLLEAGTKTLSARSVPPDLWWLALLAPAASLGGRFAASRMRPSFGNVAHEPGETPIILAPAKVGGGKAATPVTAGETPTPVTPSTGAKGAKAPAGLPPPANAQLELFPEVGASPPIREMIPGPAPAAPATGKLPRIDIAEIKSIKSKAAGWRQINGRKYSYRIADSGHEAVITYDENGVIFAEIKVSGGQSATVYNGEIGRVPADKMPKSQFGTKKFGDDIEDPIRELLEGLTGQKFVIKHPSATGPDVLPHQTTIPVPH